MRAALLVIAVMCCATARAHAEEAERLVPDLSAGALKAKLFGSLRPTVGVAYHDDAVPADRWAYGIAGSSVDLGLDATVGAGLSAAFYVSLQGQRGDNGSTTAAVSLERALVRYQPIRFLELAVGRDRVPMSAQSATPTVARVFPTRIALDETFVLPADVGGQVIARTDHVSAYAGVWNGIASDVMLEPGATERGLLYSVRVEATPLGPFAFDEAARDSELRVGIGLGATYRAATAFTPIGEPGVRSRDLRAALAARIAWRGLFVQTEVLRRQITDDLSMRPDVATGGYAQASWRLQTERFDIAPLARAGVVRVRQLSAPATGSSIELGAAVFPLARSSDRLQVSTLLSRVVDPDLGSPALQALTQLRLGF